MKKYCQVEKKHVLDLHTKWIKLNVVNFLYSRWDENLYPSQMLSFDCLLHTFRGPNLWLNKLENVEGSAKIKTGGILYRLLCDSGIWYYLGRSLTVAQIVRFPVSLVNKERLVSELFLQYESSPCLFFHQVVYFACFSNFILFYLLDWTWIIYERISISLQKKKKMLWK